MANELDQFNYVPVQCVICGDWDDTYEPKDIFVCFRCEKENTMSIGHLLFGITGRINRKRWWFGQLLAVFIAAVISFVFHHSIPHTFGWYVFSLHNISYGTVIGVYYFCVHGALNMKRWHDLNKSGWYLFLNYLLPPIGFIILGISKGDTEENKYGAVPI